MVDAPNTPHDLVSFDRPPVQEIAFAIQLIDAQLSVENMVDVGRALHPSFPVRQLQPPLPRMVEPVGPQSLSISTTIGVPLPRFWFVSEDGIRLVQVQEDRIAFNWRRLGRDVAYPRYAKLRPEFEDILGRRLLRPAARPPRRQPPRRGVPTEAARILALCELAADRELALAGRTRATRAESPEVSLNATFTGASVRAGRARSRGACGCKPNESTTWLRTSALVGLTPACRRG